MLNLHLLRIFHAVAHHQSVIHAATSLHITQPAVSNAIKKLQHEYEVSLFYKSGRHLKLTEEGINLYTFSQQIFEIAQQADSYLMQLKPNAPRNIRIGLVTLYERYFVDKIVNIFHEIDSSVTVSIVSGNSSSVLQMLLHGDVDMAVSGSQTLENKLKRFFFKKHNVYLFAPQGHPLYGKKTFNAKDLKSQKIISKERGSAIRQTVDTYLNKYSIQVDSVVELSNLDSILDLATKEKCLSFLPETHQSIENSTIKQESLLIAQEGDLYFDIHFYFLPEHRYTPSHLAFFSKLQQVLQMKLT